MSCEGGPSDERPEDADGAPAQAVSRRALLAAGAALPVAAVVPGVASAAPALAAPAQLQIRPRAEWAGGRVPLGPLEHERPQDVRFLLVHHTATTNSYSRAGAVQQLRGIYAYHTSPTKGWPDVAYNFLVDRYGSVWEGRTGSLRAPVKASATGGSQGFAMLACYLGDHEAVPPTPAARAAMISLLAYLADTYDVDTRPGATASFTSRGSNRWPAGRRVTTPTISGHRDMSLTTCPGRYVYPDLRGSYPIEVSAARGTSVGPPASRPSASSPPSAQPGTPAQPQAGTAPGGGTAPPGTAPSASSSAAPASAGSAAPATTTASAAPAAGAAASSLPTSGAAAAPGPTAGADTAGRVMGLGALVVAAAAAVAAGVVRRRA